jgi:hypothetical protein
MLLLLPGVIKILQNTFTITRVLLEYFFPYIIIIIIITYVNVGFDKFIGHTWRQILTLFKYFVITYWNISLHNL